MADVSNGGTKDLSTDSMDGDSNDEEVEEVG